MIYLIHPQIIYGGYNAICASLGLAMESSAVIPEPGNLWIAAAVEHVPWV